MGHPVPLYHQILQLLRDRIASGHYPVGRQLPTDAALMREFGVSRHTVRAALQELVSTEIVERFPGRGSFVLRQASRSGPWSVGSIEDLIDTSFADTYRVLEARSRPSSLYPMVAEFFGLQPRERLFRIRAVRSSRVGPYAYSHVYFPLDIGEKLPHRLFNRRPLILLVEEYCGLPAFEARQTALAEAADGEVARHLGIRPGRPVLVLERTYFGRDGRPLEFSRIRHRSDRYQQTVNFTRKREPPYQRTGRLERRPSRGALR
jgi:GntR family transcriptional regulator